MYAKVKTTKNVTKKWLDRAFAPLSHYLHAHYPDEAERIIGYLMFMGNEDGKFSYKNSITRAYIVFDQAGELVSLDKDALQYQFEWLSRNRDKSEPVETNFIHPNVDKWMERNLKKKTAVAFGKELRIFLQYLWGPVVNFDFHDLKAGYPLKGSGSPYCLYIYPSEFQKLISFQFVGDEIAEGRCSFKQYQKFQKCESEFMFEGWQLMTLIREFMESESALSMTREVMIKIIDMADWRDQQYVLTAAALKELEKGDR